MDITVLYVQDCPHVGLARQRIAEALDRVGVAATATERLVRTDAEAATSGFRGSPTILIDGVDPFPINGAAGLSCRLYPGDGGVEGAPTVEQLVEALTPARVIRAGGGNVDDALVDRLRWAAFDRLRGNRPATPADLAADLECTAEIVAEILAAEAALGRVEVDVDGVVVGSHGLTLVPTRHALTIDGAELHTWCAFDAVGIPAAAGEDARVATRCGWCERPLAVAIAAGIPDDDDGNRVVLWLPTGPCDDLRRQFCAHANLFCEREHLDRWLAQADEPSGRVLTLADTAELGRQSWRRPAPVARTSVRWRGRRGRA